MKRKLTLSLIQTDLHWENKSANLKHFSSLLNRISEPVHLVVLPEMFTTGFSMKPDQLAEPSEGPTLEWMQTQAEGLKSVICGSVIIEEGNQYYNRLFWVNPDGSYQYYDKRHLFTLGKEHQHYQPGSERILVEVNGWKVLPLICYDLRFPVWSRNTDDYDLLLYVANWPAVRRKAWTTLLNARAVENQTYTVGVNRIGLDGNHIPHSGDSGVYNFEGNTIMHTAEVEGVFTLTLDLEEQLRFREKLPFLKDRDTFDLKV